MALSPAPESVLTVAQLTRLIRESLEGTFPAVWVKGELSGCKRAESGHLYFALKDRKDALIDCVMFRTEAMRLAFDPRDGTEAEAFGSITVYEPRGRYQLKVLELRPAGLGALLVALEQLKQRLQAEGLFDPARKRPLPRYPSRIGVVTSPVGAAARDIVRVLKTRWTAIQIVFAATRVQGIGAAQEIAAAIRRFDRYGRVELLIVGRGGGSLEDLWAFNEEIVVRAIAASRVPVISAVGHEVDWTLADHAADARAATPSNAAEMAVRDGRDVRHRIEVLSARSGRALHRGIERRRHRVQSLIDKYGFRRQRDALRFIEQRIDEVRERMRMALASLMRSTRARLEHVTGRYGLRQWPATLDLRRAESRKLSESLTDFLVRGVHDRRLRLAAYADRLRALSPRLVLERGFCIARMPDGTLVRTAERLAAGELLALEFARGEADARIEKVRPGGDHAA